MKTTNPFKEVQRLLKSSIQSKTSRHKKRKSGPYRFEVRLVPPEAYPDLKENPFNPYTQLSDEERLEEFIEIMGVGLGGAGLVEGRLFLPPPLLGETGPVGNTKRRET